MKMVKSLILGSAAGLLAMGGAQAADLPVKAKAVEYVKICSLYGAGFFYIPGTDTCIKLGGTLLVDTYFNAGISESPAWSGDLGQQNRYRNYFDSRARFRFNVDTRTATEYGVVRTFGQTSFTFDTFGGSSTNPATSGSGAGLAANLASPANLSNTPGGGFTTMDFAFVQFAGFTFGKSASAFATPWHGFPGNMTAFLLGGHDTVNGTNNIQYTAQFGNGVSATIGLDESVVHNRTALLNAGPLMTAGAAIAPAVLSGGVNAYGGNWAPDIVGNIRVDQAWGVFQVSAAAHLLNASYNILTSATATAAGSAIPTNLSEISGHPDSKWGGAVAAALQIKNLPTGAGDDIKIDATWATGDTKQVISTASTSPSFAMFSGTGRAGAYQSFGFGQTADAIYLPVVNGGDGQIKLVNSYGIRGAFNHNWDAQWSTSLWGSASAVRYGGTVGDLTTAKGVWCAAFGAGKGAVGGAVLSADFTCNPDYNVYQVGLTTRWTPVRNLTFAAEVGWFRLDQKMTGAITMIPSAPKPVATYEFKDQDTVMGMVRVQRNF